MTRTISRNDWRSSSVCRPWLRAASLIALVMALTDCASIVLSVASEPASLTLLRGERGAVTVVSVNRALLCDPFRDPSCLLFTGMEIDYQVENVPASVTAEIDRSLQSRDTPSVVRVVFDVGPFAAQGLYDVLIYAVVGSHRVGSTVVSLRIVTDQPSAEPAPIALITAGASHSMLVGPTPAVAFTVGDNSTGQLGSGNLTSRAFPVRVPDIDNVSGAAAGGNHTLAVRADGTVWAWGANDDGQLGLGTRLQVMPAPIPGVQNVRAVAAGHAHSLALGLDGHVRAWGDNSVGQLGDGTEIRRPNPVDIASLDSVRSIAAGHSHSLALRTDGSVWTWGASDGPLGTHRSVPAQVPGLTDVVGIAAGSGHSLALRSDGTVWAWGKNDFGQVGHGTTGGIQASPVHVTGVSDVLSIAAGGDFSLALRRDGTVWAWGANSHGQLGDGGEIDRASPFPVSGLTGIRSIAAGGRHSIALAHCGQVWAWGGNESGQLGDGSRLQRAQPATVVGAGTEAGCAAAVLRVAVIGAGGVVHGHGGILDCGGHDCVGVLNRDAFATLSAVPLAGASFQGWEMDCQGTSPDIVVLMDRSKQCVARFTSDAGERFLLTVDSKGGTVTSGAFPVGELGPSSIACGETCNAIFRKEAIVTLTAVPAAGFIFSGWSGCTADGSTCTAEMTANRTVVALFSPSSLTACFTLRIESPFAAAADASCSTGDIVQYRWWADYFGPAQPPTATTDTPISPTFVYELPGTRTIRLEVVDANGRTAATAMTFTGQ